MVAREREEVARARARERLRYEVRAAPHYCRMPSEIASLS
jgi:hypothetical protein